MFTKKTKRRYEERKLTVTPAELFEEILRIYFYGRHWENSKGKSYDQSSPEVAEDGHITDLPLYHSRPLRSDHQIET
jgi:hypothetical protein